MLNFHTKLKAFEDSDIITIGGYMMEHYPNLKKGESVDLEGFKRNPQLIAYLAFDRSLRCHLD